jgi:AcrR family transcriptional regulator
LLADERSSLNGSLRDARKRRTKRALRDAALKLFAAKGYDTTTTEEIAERAGVSARTFFRYFPTKESVLFEGEGAWFEAFGAEYCRHQSDVSDIDAICATLTKLSPGIVHRRAALRLYELSVASSSTLRGLKQQSQELYMATLANAMAQRRNQAAPDETCMLQASVVVLLHERTIHRWLAGPAGGDLNDIIADEIAILAAAFGGPQVKPPSQQPRTTSDKSPY